MRVFIVTPTARELRDWLPWFLAARAMDCVQVAWETQARIC